MGKTAAERQRERRKRLKEDIEEYERYKEKDRQRKNAKQTKSRKTLTKHETAILREKERIRKRDYRKKLKEKKTALAGLHSPSHVGPAYSTPQTKAKAVKKALKSLPASPRKIHCVIRELASAHSVSITQNIKQKPKCNALCEINDLVKSFYHRDDISLQAPGKKDVAIIRGNEGKEKFQKRFLYTTIAEAYQIFKKENPDKKVGKSKFFSLRPKYVLPISEMPHHSCLCRYHENINLLLTALCEYKNDIPKSSSELIATLVCNIENEICMSSACDSCGIKKLVSQHESLRDDTNDLTWFVWKTVDGKIEKVLKESTVSGAFEELVEKIPQFLKHCFLVKTQGSYFQEKKCAADGKEITLQIDFAENYTARFQNEIQSAYWNSQQITIFTAVAWIGPGMLQSYAIVSDEISHDKYAVNTFLRRLISVIRETNPEISTINFFSDGAASHFKQRYSLCNLTHLQKEFKVLLRWNFLATGHGKGSVDGVGGELKRLVWHAVLGGKDLVTNAESFYRCARKVAKSLKVLFCSEDEVNQQKPQFDACVKDIKAIPDTHSQHYFEVASPYNVVYKEHSLSKKGFTFNFMTGTCVPIEVLNVHSNLQVGAFVVVNFMTKRMTKYFVGQILKLDKTECEISFLRKSGSDSKFAFKTNDTSWVQISDILKVLPVPDIDNRQRFSFPGVDVTDIS